MNLNFLLNGERRATRRIVAGMILFLVLASILTIGVKVSTTDATPLMLGSGSDTKNWPMFRYNPTHSGHSISIAPNRNSTKWIYTTRGALLSSPAVANGRVFIGSSDNKTYALDERTGASIWNYTTGGVVTSSPAIANGKVFVGSYDKKVYALNETTGALVWSYETGSLVSSSPTIDDGKVFIGSSDGKIYALNEANGFLIWTYTTGGSVSSSSAVADGKVFVGSHDGKVYALNKTTGALIWSYTTGGSVTSSPSVSDGRVFVGSSDGKVYALNEINGLVIWASATGASVGSSSAVAFGKVFVGSYDKRVYAFNETTGGLIWSYATANYVLSSPAVADGKVFVGSYDNYVYALKEASGKLIWNYTTGATVSSSPAVSDGMVFVGSWNGKIYAFGIHDLAILSVTPSKTTIIRGETININVVVKNEGNFTEVFSVSAYYNTTLIATQTLSLDDGASTNAVFNLNTASMALGFYTLNAMVNLVPDETDTADNALINGTIKLIDYPIATFNFSPAVPLANQTVTFDASASSSDGGAIVSYSWNFGDGNSGEGKIVTHAYTWGDYLVTLTVLDNEGLTDDAAATVKVIWYPTAKFSYSPTIAIMSERVTFDASASTPNGGTISNYAWGFGDGKTGSGKIATHNYTSVGIFVITLTVTDSEGLSNVTQTSVKTYARPTPDFYYYPTYPSIGELVAFDASFSFDFDGTVVSYQWNFSDGTPTLSGKIVTHYFSANGVYAVKLTATDNDGITNTKSVKIGVGTLTGDINFDGKVDIKDIAAVAKAFGKNLGMPGYVSGLDLNGDFKIDIKDIATAARNFGKVAH